MSDLSDKLQKVAMLLRLMDVGIERHLNPHLSSALFNYTTGKLGEHLYVLPYTTDIRAALSLPQADASLTTPLDVVIEWIKRNGL